MPSSYPTTIPVAIELAWKLQPMTVLDLGCGYGKYGTLFREYLGLRHRDVLNGDCAQGSYDDLRDGHVRIDAVEGWAPYVGELHNIVYDNVYIENIVEFCQRPWQVEYDLAFLCDVVEHIERPAGRALLETVAQRARMGVFVSLPYHDTEQGSVFGNTLETHQSHWRCREFRALAPFVKVGRKGGSLMAFLTRNRACYHTVCGSAFRRKLRLVRDAFCDTW